MASLPADLTKHALSFLAVADVPRGAALCKAWSAAARAPDLWLALCEARWPSTVSGALRQAVLRRGPREYYRQHAAALCARTPRRPRSDFDDLLVQLELTQNGRPICSVAREARDVLRRDCEDYDHRDARASLRDGVIFDNLRARVDTSKDNEFPPRKDPVSISYSVIRKSDGRVAALVPTTELEWTCGWSFGRGGGGGSFAANPLLRGALPASYEHPTLLDVDPQDVLTTWLLGRMSGTQRVIGTHVCKTVAAVHIGTWGEFPYDSEPWTPSPDPSVVAGDGYVELRRIFTTFTLRLEERVEDEELREEEGDFICHDCHDLDPDELRRAFDQRLVFR